MGIKERKEFQVVILTAIVAIYGIYSSRLPSTISVYGQDIDLEIIWIGALFFNIIAVIALFVLLYSTKTENPFKKQNVEEMYENLFNISFMVISFSVLFFIFLNLYIFANRIFNPNNDAIINLVIMGGILYVLIRLTDRIKASLKT